MKKRNRDTPKTAIILCCLIVFIRMLEGIPWWSFAVPVLAFGTFIALRQWKVSCFLVGFSCGFVIWFFANVYFHLGHGGVILSRLGAFLSIAMLLASGVVGGLVTGLALYTGKAIIPGKKTIPAGVANAGVHAG